MNTQHSPVRQQLVEQRRLNISCIVPVHNEAENLEAFFSDLQDKLQQFTDQFEILFVDDGSQDDSLLHIRKLVDDHPAAKCLVLSRNFGKELAILAGLEHSQGDVTLIIDADFQHPLDMVDAFIEHWAQGYDNVYGVRKNRKDEGFFKRHSTHAFYRLLDTMTEVHIPPNAGDFRLLDRKVVASLRECQERARFTKGLYAWVGYRSIGLPFVVQERAGGKSSWKLRRLTNLAITGLTAFSDIPLRIWGMIGGIISLLCLISILYIIVDTYIYGISVPGYATLLVTVIFFGGMQLFSIGVLGEYISRIFNEVKRRPPYIIAEKLGLDQHD